MPATLTGSRVPGETLSVARGISAVIRLLRRTSRSGLRPREWLCPVDFVYQHLHEPEPRECICSRHLVVCRSHSRTSGIVVPRRHGAQERVQVGVAEETRRDRRHHGSVELTEDISFYAARPEAYKAKLASRAQ